MSNKAPLNIRIKFEKKGCLQYISHLDLVRTMHKVIVRAGLPLWYTEGFNPKPKMVFAAPLSIGTESLCEFMDIRLVEEKSTESVMAALNKNLTDELRVVEVYYPETKLTDLKWLAYDIRIKSPHITEEVFRLCLAALSADEMKVEKKGGAGELDIKPLIKSVDASVSGNEMYIQAVLSADASSFLNPEYLVKYLRNSAGILTDPNLLKESYSILRTAAYTADMKEYR